MPASNWELNRFERILFRVAIVLGAVLIAVRIGTMIVLWFAHYH